MPMRVIAGSAKGRELKVVPGDTTRPVMDRVKEALFNIIGRDVYDATLLDLFAGTGSIGIEALSRGAGHVTFVDLERRAIDTIRHNLTVTKLANRATVRRADAFDVLKHPPTEPFDFIYIAPPQYKGLWEQSLLALDAHPAWLAPDVRIIVQIDPTEAKQLTLLHLELEDERKYGNTLLWFFIARQPLE
jgi:16S rRNA (guanine(966)-N(2))-methyltransferase RsmD